MALLPMLLDELENYRRPVDFYGPDFDIGFRRGRGDMLSPFSGYRSSPALHAYYLRPWRASQPRESGVSRLSNSEDGFKVNIDVQQFKPDEISVKVVDNFVVVEGKHEERQDEHGYIQRQFTRRYALPQGVDPETITSSLSSDGVLMVSAPKKPQLQGTKERAVPITQTQAPAIQQTSKTDKKEESMDS